MLTELVALRYISKRHGFMEKDRKRWGLYCINCGDIFYPVYRTPSFLYICCTPFQGSQIYLSIFQTLLIMHTGGVWGVENLIITFDLPLELVNYKKLCM